MKKIIVYLMCILLLFSGCAPNEKEDEVVKKDEKSSKKTSTIVPSYQLSKDDYRMVLPFRPSKARGVIVNQVANRLDIDEVENGLRRHSKEVFDPDKYYYEEGQYLTEEMVYNWLGRTLTKDQLKKEVKEQKENLEEAGKEVDEEKIKKDLQQGLNPSIEDDSDKNAHQDNPKYLSHIVEQNYLKKKEDNSVKLAGISIGLSMKSVYRYQTETGGPYYYEDISKEEMEKQGNKIAERVLKRLRKIDGLENVPIMISLYREAKQGSPVPGNFVAKTTVPEGENSIGKWKSIKEEYVLFPSDRAKEAYYDDAEIVSSFGKDIAEYFPNYVGVIGEGLYVDKELRKLSIEIPIEFNGESEIVGFTQYTFGLIKEMFPDYYDLEVKITSSDQIESVIYRESGKKEPIVHIFH
ncbi:CamS family sex pheromone protein [Virgibacillus alimentarius]|uniref:Protein involved in sex pheromone biosynthesis n=1 Tax=Virgibacillus alimentarius TaxID=698769 RepID=A0ABS4S857_9BACI|nr:CamS family sex pheromone protein [Virgibacillus alimentarius]MBP2257681.1 protein involved in sex pheromone biosynthesis [Virgibacillus alimentarius]